MIKSRASAGGAEVEVEIQDIPGLLGRKNLVEEAKTESEAAEAAVSKAQTIVDLLFYECIILFRYLVCCHILLTWLESRML